LSAAAEPWRRSPEGLVIACRLTPKGGRDAIEGVARLADGTSVLLARVRNAPEEGRANEALCALLAKTLDAPSSSIKLVAGAKGRVKRIAVTGDPDSLIARLRAFNG